MKYYKLILILLWMVYTTSCFHSFKPKEGKDFDVLISNLKSDNLITKTDAIYDIKMMGPSAKDAIPSLIDIFKDDNPMVRHSIPGAVARLDPDFMEVQGFLATAFSDKDIDVRDSVIFACEEFVDKGAGELDITKFMAAIESGLYAIDAVQRTQTITLLNCFNNIPQELKSRIADLARNDESISVRREAIKLIINIGDNSTLDFSQFLRDDSAEIRALGLIHYLKSPEEINEVKEDIIRLVNNGEVKDFFGLILVYGVLKEECGIDMTETYLRLLKEGDEELRAATAEVLGSIPSNEMVIEGLVLALDDKSGRVRTNSAMSLGLTGKAAQKAMGKLEFLSKNDTYIDEKGEYTVREAALKAISAIKSSI